jgi:hypothetical protein
MKEKISLWHKLKLNWLYRILTIQIYRSRGRWGVDVWDFGPHTSAHWGESLFDTVKRGYFHNYFNGDSWDGRHRDPVFKFLLYEKKIKRNVREELKK